MKLSGFGSVIWEDGLEEGLKKGEVIGQIKMLYNKFGYTPEKIAEETNCTIEYVKEVLGK